MLEKLWSVARKFGQRAKDFISSKYYGNIVGTLALVLALLSLAHGMGMFEREEFADLDIRVEQLSFERKNDIPEFSAYVNLINKSKIQADINNVTLNVFNDTGTRKSTYKLLRLDRKEKEVGIWGKDVKPVFVPEIFLICIAGKAPEFDKNFDLHYIYSIVPILWKSQGWISPTKPSAKHLALYKQGKVNCS